MDWMDGGDGCRPGGLADECSGCMVVDGWRVGLWIEGLVGGWRCWVMDGGAGGRMDV